VRFNFGFTFGVVEILLWFGIFSAIGFTFGVVEIMLRVMI